MYFICNYEYNTKNATIKENNPVASAKANFVKSNK